MRKVICFMLLMPVVSPIARASCSFYTGVSAEVPGYLNFGNVVVQRDAPIGSVLATAVTGAYNSGNPIAGCTREAWTARWELTQWGTLSGYGDGVYNTNLVGVGLRLTTAQSGKVLPYEASYPYNAGGSWASISGDGIKGELIKTGDITSGTLTDGTLARASVVNQFYFANVTLNGTNTVTAAACSVTSVDEPVQLGDHNKQEFSGVGYTTEWKAFNIVLDCNKSAHIYVQIDATRDASNAPGVMAIDSESGSTAATGVGVQLYFVPDNSAAQFGQVKDYYTSPNGGMETVQLKARYYQTASAVTTGPANATATFTLTYK
ncbi:fimbrial protein [Klebsiella michiganensis]|uniref:fimbrial protein n=1 Tax=Klebsiella michiganensis TaxID=1134687 RepID=UPI001118C84D|nr:fimbrial protein [Klebsiella michiganensis]MBR7531992.1 fimbrial protein [Klebsiella michiganensis]MBR7573854.1 fimbrial protein [Klebsiella michiganensis]MCW9515807.1 fimbrial protein [Klebsiella michiganensis]NWN30705.1 fimbrial protein [Klebsiella michiganensis]